MIALKLLRIEWFKTWHRVAFWVAGGFLLSVLFLGMGMEQILHARNPAHRAFGLPGGWREFLGGTPELAMLCLVTLVALLVASEQGWRTQRQNVIDGLSRGQYFAGKVGLAALLVVIFWLLAVGSALFYAAFDGAPGYADGSGPLLDAATAASLAGFLLYLLGVAMAALLFAVLSSSSGAALAFSFLFFIVQLPLMFTFTARGGGWLYVAQRLPTQVLATAKNPVVYDTELLRSFNDGLRAGAPVPPLLGPLENNLWAAGYIGGFVLLAWLAFRRRDL